MCRDPCTRAAVLHCLYPAAHVHAQEEHREELKALRAAKDGGEDEGGERCAMALAATAALTG